MRGGLAWPVLSIFCMFIPMIFEHLWKINSCSLVFQNRLTKFDHILSHSNYFRQCLEMGVYLKATVKEVWPTRVVIQSLIHSGNQVLNRIRTVCARFVNVCYSTISKYAPSKSIQRLPRKNAHIKELHPKRSPGGMYHWSYFWRCKISYDIF